METIKKVLKFLLTILYNKKYRKGSLYGAGIFPFWIYIKFFGKPVYKLCRRIGINRFFSLMGANVLGSLSHVGFFSTFDLKTVVYFIGSLFLLTGIFYGLHFMYSKSRN